MVLNDMTTSDLWTCLLWSNTECMRPLQHVTYSNIYSIYECVQAASSITWWRQMKCNTQFCFFLFFLYQVPAAGSVALKESLLLLRSSPRPCLQVAQVVVGNMGVQHLMYVHQGNTVRKGPPAPHPYYLYLQAVTLRISLVLAELSN